MTPRLAAALLVLMASVLSPSSAPAQSNPCSPFTLCSGGGGAGTGDVVGPASSTDQAICRYGDTTGNLLADSSVTLSATSGVFTQTTANTGFQFTSNGTGNAIFSWSGVDDSFLRVIRSDNSAAITLLPAAAGVGNEIRSTAKLTISPGGVVEFNGSGVVFRDAVAADTGAERIAAGILGITDGTEGGRGTMSAKAVRVATANGATWVRGESSELLTLSTSGTTTDSVADLLPANSIIGGVACRVTTTITTATDWSIGDVATAARFSAASVNLTAGSTVVGLAHQGGAVSTDATGPTQADAAKLRITTTGTPGAGAIRCTVFYSQFTAPTS